MKNLLSTIFGNIGITDQLPLKKLKPNAKVVFLMDRSGSMDPRTKQYAAAMAEVQLAKLKQSHKRVTPVYMTYTTGRQHVMTHTDLEDMITERTTGGTITSSGLQAVIENHRATEKTDMYVVLLSDGDNWQDDALNVDASIDLLYSQCGIRGMAYHEVTRRVSQTMGRSLQENPRVDTYFRRNSNYGD